MAKEGSVFINLLPISYRKKAAISTYLRDINDILKINPQELRKMNSILSSDVETITKYRHGGYLEDELSSAEKNGIRIIDKFDSEFPLLLNEIPDSPFALYLKGDRDCLNGFNFAVVGTRTPTIYGLKTADFFAYELALMGTVVISGLARGIDSAVHRGALKGGRTVAVLGSGLLNIYPRENLKLAGQISENGAVMSEFPLNTAPLRENFPRRNRIISGISKGVLVVEASSRSGAIITANLALEQNREVFSLPGSIDSPLSKGTNDLIKQGARLVDCLCDILQEFNIDFRETARPQRQLFLNTQEETVFTLVRSNKAVFLEDIVQKSGLTVPAINRAILQLQIKGIIKEVKPLFYASAL